MSKNTETYDGGCTCGYVRYRMESEPLVVHCCHCSWCQRQTGSAFVVNVLVEADRVKLLQGDIAEITVSSPSGASQIISRCPKCQVAVWSNYLVMRDGLGKSVRFIRAGTLDDPGKTPPDVHIYTVSKQAWVTLAPDAVVAKEFYEVDQVWSQESLERWAVMSAAVKNKGP